MYISIEHSTIHLEIINILHTKVSITNMKEYSIVAFQQITSQRFLVIILPVFTISYLSKSISTPSEISQKWSRFIF